MQKVFFSDASSVYLVQSLEPLSALDREKISWALKASPNDARTLPETYIGPRAEMVTPWSTNCTEILQNMGIPSVRRVEMFRVTEKGGVPHFDSMLESVYDGLRLDSLDILAKAEPGIEVTDIEEFNRKEGLALSDTEVDFLKAAEKKLGRKLTDTEAYGFAQINSEHCRHKIFNGAFVIDGKEQPKTLFQLIKDTSAKNGKNLISAYKDNVAFIRGPKVQQFAPRKAARASNYESTEIDSIISLKAETHNFPTTVEPFFGASTGSGGEIRDRMAGGKGSIPLVGTAVYMTAYPRLSGSRAQKWESGLKERNWKYQTPQQILTKASNGASDFGNKFGQPLIVGSLLTFESKTARGAYGFDRVIMLAGGVGYAKESDAQKAPASKGDKLVLLGGDNYRIGMAGGSVSSVDTGKYSAALELSAVQRANPEMQKRVFNVVRSLAESSKNPIKLIHDHGAGGHINCFSELVDSIGGKILISQLPVGDPTLSAKEIICNESQERMGLIVSPEDIPLLQEIAERERAPMYVVGETTGDEVFSFVDANGESPVNLPLEILFGSAPKTVLEDQDLGLEEEELEYTISSASDFVSAIEDVLSLEGVACKDWLTNKVDRSVTGRIALQQTCGPLQLPLNNLGVVAIDHAGTAGIGSSLGHAPVAGLADERAGAVLAVAESLTNIVWAPIPGGLQSVALSANWMWPAKQKGENIRLYRAVEALSAFCQKLDIPVPTGKDSLSMTMNYADGKVVRAPGTVVVSAVCEISPIDKIVTPDLKPVQGSKLLYVDLSGMRSCPLAGSSFAQTVGQIGRNAPRVEDAARFKSGFELIQSFIREGGVLLSGHDVSSGGVLTTALEMSFTGDVGCELTLPTNAVEFAFCEKPGVILQLESDRTPDVQKQFEALGLSCYLLGEVRGTQIRVHAGDLGFSKSVSELRRVWFKPSFLLDSKQTKASCAKERFETFEKHPLKYRLPQGFNGKPNDLGADLFGKKRNGIQAAIVRDKGTNGERELAYALFIAGFDVKDVTMTDLVSGREDLSDVSFLAFPGGFSNSDVLGSARGWAGAFRFNARADEALRRFYDRQDTMSIGVCNGCQLMMELGLVYRGDPEHPRMQHNESGRFESTFVGVRVPESPSILLKPLFGSDLGVWVAHGEGRFEFPKEESSYHIALKFMSADYPANPNGSHFNAAAVSSADGRHLAIMPHIERSLFAWNWPYHGSGFPEDAVLSPWALAFRAASDWFTSKKH